MAAQSKSYRITFTTIKYFFLVLFSIFFLFPVYALLINSVMPDTAFGERTLWPDKFNFNTYKELLDTEYLGYLKNTLLVCVLNILGVCIMSTITAYGLAKVKFKGKNVVFLLIMSTVLLPGTVTSIPLFIIYKKMGWNGELYPLWVPIWFGGGAMNIFLVRQFMRGIPNSYSEAAVLDGANNFQIYYKVVMPLVRPIVIYLAVTTFFGAWNDFQGPLMYVADVDKNWTLSLALYQKFGKENGVLAARKNIQMAIGVMMMLPCAVLFGFFQNELMEGVSTIGLKG